MAERTTSQTTEHQTIHFGKIAVFGVGLLGGSFALACREGGLCEEVIGIGRSTVSLEEARRVGAITGYTSDVAAGVAQADLIMLATPVGHITSVLAEVAAAAKPGAVITDVGSTKASIVAAGEAACDAAARGVHFVGSHPMAGSEKSGVHHSRADLFQDSTCFVTKTEATHLPSFARVSALWRALGCRLVVTRPERHDRLVALVSHLPHLAAVSLVMTVQASEEDRNLIKGIIGNGFRHTTRIAEGSPDMWEDIACHNHAEIRQAAEAMMESLQLLLAASSQKHGEAGGAEAGGFALGAQKELTPLPGGAAEAAEPLRDILERVSEFRQFLNPS